MRRQVQILLFLISAFYAPSLSAEENAETNPAVDDLDSLLRILFDDEIQSDHEFESYLGNAAMLGATPQILMEARIARIWKNGEFEKVVVLLPEIDALLHSWDIEKSEIFRNPDELYGYYHFFRALEAKQKENNTDFEASTKESFWFNPELGTLLAFFIEEHRKAERLDNLVLPMDLPISTSQGDSITLEHLAKDKKGILLDFWATWCAPCIALMPELMKKAEILEPQGLVVAGLNTESIEKAENFRLNEAIELSWLVEPSGGPIGRLLMIDSLPRMILLNPEGKVLFNGHPMEPSLKDALAEIDVTF